VDEFNVKPKSGRVLYQVHKVDKVIAKSTKADEFMLAIYQEWTDIHISTNKDPHT